MKSVPITTDVVSSNVDQGEVYKWFAIGQWFSPGPPVSSTNKTDPHDIPEILLKVALGTIKQTNKQTNKQSEQLVAKKNYICLLIAFLMCAIL